MVYREFLVLQPLRKKYKLGAGGSRLQSELLRRQKSRGSQFEASPANTSRNPNQKNSITKNRADGVAQGEGPEFKFQYHKNKQKKKKEKNKLGTHKHTNKPVFEKENHRYFASFSSFPRFIVIVNISHSSPMSEQKQVIDDGKMAAIHYSDFHPEQPLACLQVILEPMSS
jgi:hypothetical protein